MFINTVNNQFLSKLALQNWYKNEFNKNLNLNNPISFSDKIQWLKFYDCIPEKTECADKIKLRNYCNNRLDINLCPPILKIYNNISEIKFENLPDKFVLKCNHGSGMNIICENKKLLNFNIEIEKLKTWYNTKFSDYYKGFEYHYNNIERKIFLEQYINIDCEYKFWCFNGKPKLCQIIFYDDCPTLPDAPKYWRRLDVLVDLDFELTDFWFKYDGIKRPYNIKEYITEHYKKYNFNTFNKYVEYSEKLANNFKFVRVDWYKSTHNKMFLSELTFTPSNGIMYFENEQSNIKLGQMLNLKN